MGGKQSTTNNTTSNTSNIHPLTREQSNSNGHTTNQQTNSLPPINSSPNSSSSSRSNNECFVPVFTNIFKCPVCSHIVLPDEAEYHLVMCLTKPRINYNGESMLCQSCLFTCILNFCRGCFD